MKLEQKMIKALEAEGDSIGAWKMANIIWDNCMEKPQPGNGVRIAHLRRVGEESKKVGTFVDSNEQRHFFLRKEECKE